jgi:V/A-type H+-transporting ATPase subunit I
MRIDLKKMLFYGIKGSLETFFNQAQELGIIEFIDKSKTKLREVPHEIQDLLKAIKVVRTLPTMDQEELESYDDATPLVRRILELNTSIEKHEEEVRELEAKKEEILPFGRFSLKDIQELKKETGRRIQYFFTKRGNPIPPELIHFRSDNTFDYFISFSTEKLNPEKMIEANFSQDLDTLEEELSQIKQKIHIAERELKSYSKYDEYLHNALSHKHNHFSLESAKHAAQHIIEGAIFSIEGWVPQNKIDEVKKLVEKLDVQSEEIQIEPDDRVPTYLQNSGFSKVGEDLVTFYDIPSKTDDDPSIWVLTFFSIFFAMIVGDGGYGLVFLATALLLRYKNPNLKAGGYRAWKLFTLLCISCIAWGLLTNSFFGITFAPDSPMRKVSVLNWLAEKKAAYHFARKDAEYDRWVAANPDLKDVTTSQEFLHGGKGMLASFNDSALIEIALLFGMIHISLSFLRYIRRNPSGIGWILAILGGYFFFPSFLKASSILHYAVGLNAESLAQSGYYMLFIGIGLAVAIAIYQRKFLGILEITAVTGVFADILSYLRLYALGLSGSVVTATINDIAGSINLTFFAVALWIIGHIINMALSVVGGVIHGLRLNFIEWYHYSFEGGGKAFTPLKKIQ